MSSSLNGDSLLFGSRTNTADGVLLISRALMSAFGEAIPILMALKVNVDKNLVSVFWAVF